MLLIQITAILSLMFSPFNHSSVLKGFSIAENLSTASRVRELEDTIMETSITSNQLADNFFQFTGEVQKPQQNGKIVACGYAD